jgi:hypothetical protein
MVEDAVTNELLVQEEVSLLDEYDEYYFLLKAAERLKVGCCAGCLSPC